MHYQLEIEEISNLSDNTILELHNLYVNYYNDVYLKTFKKDISLAQKIILVRIQDSTTNKIIGFTLFRTVETNFKGKPICAIIGGKTVAHHEYWGTPAIRRIFKRWNLEMIKFKFKNIKKKCVVFFCPTGYKTFLLLVNNFSKHMPALNNNSSELDELRLYLAEELYGAQYDVKTKLVNFNDYYALKEGVSKIEEKILDTTPNAALFQRLNPTWEKGTGLPTVALVRFSDSLRYIKKSIFKTIFKR